MQFVHCALRIAPEVRGDLEPAIYRSLGICELFSNRGHLLQLFCHYECNNILATTVVLDFPDSRVYSSRSDLKCSKS